MTRKFKCPVCGNAVRQYVGMEEDEYMCKFCNCMTGDEDLWMAFIKTKKQLDLAMDWLKQVETPAKCDDDLCREFTKRKIAEIHALDNQKEEE